METEEDGTHSPVRPTVVTCWEMEKGFDDIIPLMALVSTVPAPLLHGEDFI